MTNTLRVPAEPFISWYRRRFAAAGVHDGRADRIGRYSAGRVAGSLEDWCARCGISKSTHSMLMHGWTSKGTNGDGSTRRYMAKTLDFEMVDRILTGLGWGLLLTVMYPLENREHLLELEDDGEELGVGGRVGEGSVGSGGRGGEVLEENLELSEPDSELLDCMEQRI